MLFSDPLILTVLVILAIVIIIVARMLFSKSKVDMILGLMQDGKLDEAIKKLQGFIAAGSKDPSFTFLLAECYFTKQDYEKAFPLYGKLLQAKKFNAFVPEKTLRERLGQIYLKIERLEEAQAEYLRLCEMEPTNQEYLLQTARILQERSLNDEAIKHYKQLLALAPKHDQALASLGELLYSRKQYQEAAEYLQRCIELAPKNARAHYFLGMIYQALKQQLPAMNEFDLAIQSREFRARALVQKGIALMEINDITHAMQELERGIQYAKGDDIQVVLYARYYLGSCYQQTGDVYAAVEQWEQVRRLRPGFMDVEQKLAAYKEFVVDDTLKDFSISNGEVFLEMCRNLVSNVMQLEINEINLLDSEQVELTAREPETKWKKQLRIKIYIRILRYNENINESSIRDILETAKQASAHKAIAICSTDYTPNAREFAQLRTIELVNGNQLAEMLRKIER